jgi:hypothetical protein
VSARIAFRVIIFIVFIGVEILFLTPMNSDKNDERR